VTAKALPQYGNEDTVVQVFPTTGFIPTADEEVAVLPIGTFMFW
jgi:hypothetical protein